MMMMMLRTRARAGLIITDLQLLEMCSLKLVMASSHGEYDCT